MKTKCLCLRQHPELRDKAAAWFSTKWGISAGDYRTSIDEAIRHPHGRVQWYVVLDDDDNIIAGNGIIENDFHNRKDLSPNFCALYVEEVHRNQGIARALLDNARRDMADRGVAVLYLVTDLTGVYERCGWRFVCMATGDEGESMFLYSANTAM